LTKDISYIRTNYNCRNINTIADTT
jgi:hypothetical protein